MEWSGHTRTNFVHIKDRASLEAALEGTGMLFEWHGQVPNAVCFFGEEDKGGWLTSYIDDDGEVQEFNVAERILPFMEPGQVLVITSAGSEGRRYSTGWTEAWHTDGRFVSLNLRQIYELAAEKFGMAEDEIALAEYETCLPRATDVERPRG
jgi:hypothetical protein